MQAIIELRVSPKRDCGFDEVAANIARFDEVDSVMLMSGGYDLALVMSGKSFQEIALFVAKRLSPAGRRAVARPRISCCAPIKKTACCTAWNPPTNGNAACDGLCKDHCPPRAQRHASLGHPQVF